jgi:hypothetical protein
MAYFQVRCRFMIVAVAQPGSTKDNRAGGWIGLVNGYGTRKRLTGSGSFGCSAIGRFVGMSFCAVVATRRSLSGALSGVLFQLTDCRLRLLKSFVGLRII